MKIIIITRPEIFEGEAKLVNALFAQGMERLHLRKPKATKEEMAEWIDQIDLPFRHRIVLHDHHDLARKYHLGGIHLNSRNPKIPTWVLEEKKSREFTVSKSCHSIQELLTHTTLHQTQNSKPTFLDYVTLSPIYNSISKEGYGAAFSRKELAEARSLLTERVYALGGVSLEHLAEIHEMGFAGAAILGDLWFSDSPLDHFQEISMQASILG